MTIELWDMDVPYSLQIDYNDEGKDMVRITPNSIRDDISENDTICLDKDQCLELARVLRFMAKEIK